MVRSNGLGAMSTRPESVKLPVQRERRLMMEEEEVNEGFMAGVKFDLADAFLPAEDFFLMKPIFSVRLFFVSVIMKCWRSLVKNRLYMPLVISLQRRVPDSGR